MKNNRFLKVLAIAMSILMMVAIAVPAFAEEGADGDAGTTLTPIETPDDYDEWDGSFDTSPFEHITDHTQNYADADPIIIDTAEKLAGLAKYVNDAGISNEGFNGWGAMVNQKIYITKNMDMMCLDFPIIGKHYAEAQFSGLMEGRLNGTEGAAITIANLSVPSASGNNAGFIGTLRGGGVKNLTFVNAHVGNHRTSGSQGIVVGYISKTIQFFENITVIDSTLTAGTVNTPNNGYLVGTAKVDNSVTIKNCAAINCETIMNNAGNGGGLVGKLEARNTTVYTLENCFVSGCTTTDMYNSMAGFVATVQHNAAVTTAEIVIKNCHYNANMKHSDDGLNIQAILIADATGGISLSIDGLLITGANDGSVDGATPLIAYAEDTIVTSGEEPDPIDITAANIYSTVPTVVIGLTYSTFDDSAITVTEVTEADITGAAAATTLAGFDFENVWATRDGKIATLKIAVADEYDATPDQTPVDPPVGGGDDVDPPVGGGDDVDPPVGGGDDVDPPVGGDNNDTTTTTTKKDDEKKEDDGGCGSVVSATCLVTLLTVGMGVTVIRKKKD